MFILSVAFVVFTLVSIIAFGLVGSPLSFFWGGVYATSVWVIALNFMDRGWFFPSEFNDPEDDVVISGEPVDMGHNYYFVPITVTNSSRSTKDYFVQLACESENGEYQWGTGSTRVCSVRPGLSVSAEVTFVRVRDMSVTHRVIWVSRERG